MSGLISEGIGPPAPNVTYLVTGGLLSGAPPAAPASLFDAWFSAPTSPLIGTPTDRERSRAAAAWRRINDKPSSVAFRTPTGVTLAAQTVRIEVDDRSAMIESEAGAAPAMRLIVFGIKGHATLPDTIMEEGYRFVRGNDIYRIDDVVETIGERQGVALATG